MEKGKKKKIIAIALIIIVALSIMGGVLYRKHLNENIAAGSEKIDMRMPVKNDDPNFINVAMYPYVPNIEFMEKTAEKMFKEIKPEVTVNFVDWDCYINSDPKDIDVFTFDAIFLQPLLDKGYLKELSLEDYPNAEGIMPFAINDTTINDNGTQHRYGIPSLLCTFWMIYRDGDKEIEKAKSINDVYNIIGDDGIGKNKGVICNFKVDFPYYYMQAIQDDAIESNRNVEKYQKTYNKQALDSIAKMKKMSDRGWLAESQLAYWIRGEFNTGNEFRKGKGRILYGYSEEMFNLQPVIDNINVKLISMGDGEDQTIYYTDLTSMNSQVTDPKKVENCKKFIDLLVSREYINKIADNNGAVTYLLPVRDDCFKDLAEKYPMYTELKKEIDKTTNHIAIYGGWINDYTAHLTENLLKKIK